MYAGFLMSCFRVYFKLEFSTLSSCSCVVLFSNLGNEHMKRLATLICIMSGLSSVFKILLFTIFGAGSYAYDLMLIS